MAELTKKYLNKLWDEINEMNKEYLNDKFNSVSKSLSSKIEL